jgi:CheY-like chemotaxis protein
MTAPGSPQVPVADPAVESLIRLGRSVRDIAHDINNLLANIQAEHLLLLQGRPELKEVLAPLEGPLAQAVSYTRQILEYAQPGPPGRLPVDLNAAVCSAQTILAPLAAPAVVIELYLASGLPRVQGHPVNLSRIVQNLWLNAQTALAGGGRLRVETADVHLTAESLTEHPQGRPGRFVRLGVIDTGPGIPPEVLPHLFEPLVAPRKAGRGHGLGLAIVGNMVRELDGWIECQSSPGLGTAFHVYLPAIEPEGTAAAPSQPPAVLVVEPNPEVRRIIQFVLQEHGHVTRTATDWRDALTHYPAESTVCLIVLDQPASDTDLSTFLQGLHALDPTVPVLLIGTHSPRETATPRIARVLPKPFHPTQLVQAVAAARRR